ncbi:RipA family octameric membrane protein [Citrobacter youngae]|uniref:RipA family octameric membrane protein n=1 Tax=Citrobacter youngae TaxID=133448 RepID=UPI003F19E642
MKHTNEFSGEDYKKIFLDDAKKNEKALAYALDIRKFEIDLYWKRASYFWAFIAATFAGFITLQASSSVNKTDLSIILCCLGVIFSTGWLCVNRGSKHWQENWENHVDMLEDSSIGPLYKVVLTRPMPKGFQEHCEHLLTGPTSFSVSKINQLISLFVTILWVVLLFKSLPDIRFSSPFNPFYFTLVCITGLFCLLFFWRGKTYGKDYVHIAKIRSAKIKLKITQDD